MPRLLTTTPITKGKTKKTTYKLKASKKSDPELPTVAEIEKWVMEGRAGGFNETHPKINRKSASLTTRAYKTAKKEKQALARWAADDKDRIIQSFNDGRSYAFGGYINTDLTPAKIAKVGKLGKKIEATERLYYDTLNSLGDLHSGKREFNSSVALSPKEHKEILASKKLLDGKSYKDIQAAGAWDAYHDVDDPKMWAQYDADLYAKFKDTIDAVKTLTKFRNKVVKPRKPRNKIK